MVQTYAPTAIDLSRATAPDAIEALDYEALYSAFKTRFIAYWDEQRALDSSLPAYTVASLETDPAGIVGEAWSYLRLLDRQRVNDAFRALLAPLARGSNLDALVANRNIERITKVAATANTPAIMESDDSLLRRYLLSFDVPAAASAGRYIFEAVKAWPDVLDVRVNGYAVHGRRGDTDVVIIGPDGRAATEEERALVRNAVTAAHIKPEAVSVSVVNATRALYTASLVIEVPSIGPAPSVVQAEAVARVTAAANSRLLIGGEIPAGFLAGAAYGANIIAVRDLAPVAIASDPYTVPVMTGLTIAVEVRG